MAKLLSGTTIYGNAIVQTFITVTGNVIGGNLLVAGAGQISTAGNIYGNNLIINSIESVTGNITGGNILTGGQISATGNITTGYWSCYVGSTCCNWKSS